MGDTRDFRLDFTVYSQHLRVDLLFQHNFNASKPEENDIALLELTTDITYDTYRAPINLALPGDETMLTIFSECMLTGKRLLIHSGHL